jgi:hypothetical protein
VYVDAPDARGEYFPDVRIVQRERVPAGASASAAPALAGMETAAEPIVVDLTVEPITEAHIEIIDISTGRRVLTSIEILSPSNKRPGRGRRLFLRKQHELRAARVNTIEIDLLRAGRRAMVVPGYRIPLVRRTPYQVCVWRAHKPDMADVYCISLRQRLPLVRVPLRRTDDEVALDLQALIEQYYRNSGSEADIDYARSRSAPRSRRRRLGRRDAAPEGAAFLS